MVIAVLFDYARLSLSTGGYDMSIVKRALVLIVLAVVVRPYVSIYDTGRVNKPIVLVGFSIRF
jgi:hypothetical protein